MAIFVLGSFMMDCVTKTPRAPQAGETIVGTDFKNYPGGKGANQAIAARRMGSDVILAGCVGTDAYGSIFLDTLKKEEMETKYVKQSKMNSTGIGSITLEESGQNRIVVVPGANMDFTVEDLWALEDVISQCKIVITQCEMRPELVLELGKIAEKHNLIYVLNPAPARPLSKNILEKVTFLTPNETELSLLVGHSCDTLEERVDSAKELIQLGVQNVIVTLGDKGSLFVNQNEAFTIKSYKVKAVDTTGAGDSFTGSFSSCLDRGYSIEESLKIASAVGALAVGKSGAIPSLPTNQEVEKFMKEHEQ